ncbi:MULTISPECIES: 30S ribosomal protein S6 [Euryhalocaulis]|uniref:30S ribosomal protein S6 n=1 Tax=Euryhalocaulis TaxID=1712422 RepID=UPI0003A85B76|nr:MULTISPECIES: 30S ribosomal protein S6 [Euryhalocaulis]MBA4800262.1 30S ribosomal protein S6 [Euryhalocaulis sp.]
MPLYEHVLIARQDISPQQVDEIVEGLKSDIEGAGGSVKKTEYWGLRSLAFRINKNRKGHYALIGMEAPTDFIEEMERKLRIHDDVLRYMTVKVDEIDEEEPSAILSKRDTGKKRRD